MIAAAIDAPPARRGQDQNVRAPVSKAPLRIAVVLVAAALVAAGCGRRGSPEPPPGQRAPAGTLPADPDRPNGVRAPDQSFVLDPLL